MRRMAARLTPAATDRVLGRAAYAVHAGIVLKTPKKWTGRTRAAWQVSHPRIGRYVVGNTSKVMKFLEDGTRAHGPVTAKALFIPLNRRTALAGPAAVIQAQRSGLRTFVAGRDYIWRKRVRGIQPRYIVRRFRPEAGRMVNSYIRAFVQSVARNEPPRYGMPLPRRPRP